MTSEDTIEKPDPPAEDASLAEKWEYLDAADEYYAAKGREKIRDESDHEDPE
jgi:hypothetical protein